MRYAFSLLKNRISENEIAFKIEEYFARNGTRPAFLPIVASGPNSAWPHHVSSSRSVRADDVVLIDLGCTYNGYCSDLTRTFFLGKINKLRQKVKGLVKKAHDTALQDIRPGKAAREIDRASRDVISKGGYGDFFIHTTGHGLGVTVHEPPRISSLNQSKLKAGMVITVEPGIYLPGEFGVRIEDTVLITNKGREVLTS